MHTLNTQIAVDQKTKQVVYTAFSKGKRHDFRLFKESKTHIHPTIQGVTDTGYQGLQKIHPNAHVPKKNTKEDKKKNPELARDRLSNEHGIGMLKRFKIISDKDRNRRKRFG